MLDTGIEEPFAQDLLTDYAGGSDKDSLHSVAFAAEA
jgi:hypothetical protein